VRLVSIQLENIRSYQLQKVEFRDGISLFEGDIGSGKSSILNAIEFALFGLGDLSGTHLIRVGENEAKVELDIEINGRPYLFGRTLKRSRNRVQQASCYIVENGVKTDYNVTDMKKRVLQLLDFKEPSNPRSHSVIYRFAIFTPQEAMKEVLGQRPSNRKQTLRKAFGIEEYSIASENTANLANDINIDMRVLKQSAEEIDSINKNLDEEQELITKLGDNIQTTNTQIKGLQEEKNKVNEILKVKREEVRKFNSIKAKLDIQENKRNLQTDVLEQEKGRLENIETQHTKCIEAEKTATHLFPDYEKLIKSREQRRKLEPKRIAYDEAENKSELEKQKIENETERLRARIEDNIKNQKELINRIESIEDKVTKLPELLEKARRLEAKLRELPKLRKKDNEITGLISEKKQSLQTTLETRTRITNEWSEIESIGPGAECPHCQQELSPEHYELLEIKYRNEIQEVEEKTEELDSDKKEIEQKQKQIRAKIKELIEEEEQLRQTSLDIQSVETQKKELNRIIEKQEKLESETNNLQIKIDSDDYALENRGNLKKYMKTMEELDAEVKEFNSLKTIIEDFENAEIERQYLENKNLADRKQEFEKQKTASLNEIKSIESNIAGIERAINELNTSLEKYDNPEKEYDKRQTTLTVIIENIAKLTTIATENQKRIEETEKRIENQDANLKRHKRNLEQSDEYGLIRRWLEEAFIPSIHSIEQNVLRKLHNEFNRLFKKWFKTLLESEDIEGYIDEDFTPIIDQSGYELEIDSLSGGEKTSVALAYRLALNTIVKQVTDTMKSNLLILDEPTDGFSREQLYKMRDILHELNCEQVIMVSHEDELESVADHVYRVTKEGTVSSVIEP
jgi:exonuclease SbcC